MKNIQQRPLILALIRAERNSQFANKIELYFARSEKRLSELLLFLNVQNNGIKIGDFKEDIPGKNVFYFIH